MTKPENGTDRFFLQTSCASSGRNDEEERTDFKGFISKKIYIPRATHDYQYYNSKSLTIFLDIEFLEQKAFDVCDIDDDGGLSWDEVEICEVFTLQKLDVYDC